MIMTRPKLCKIHEVLTSVQIICDQTTFIQMNLDTFPTNNWGLSHGRQEVTNELVSSKKYVTQLQRPTTWTWIFCA
jgi:hypothetical protein